MSPKIASRMSIHYRHDGFSPSHRPQDAGIRQVRTIELFFDLVLVFAATQITGLIVHPHGPADYAKAALVFVSLMWVYDGHVWLTSDVALQARRDRWLFFVAMAGFFVKALGIPSVFGSGGRPMRGCAAQLRLGGAGAAGGVCAGSGAGSVALAAALRRREGNFSLSSRHFVE